MKHTAKILLNIPCWALTGIGAIVVLVIVLAIACTRRESPWTVRQPTAIVEQATKAQPQNTPTSPGPTATLLPTVGATAKKGNWEVTLEKVERADSLLASFGKPEKPQGQFLVVLVSLKNVGRETYNLYSWDFNVLAPGDVKYKLATPVGLVKLEGYEDVSLGVKVQPGLSQKVRLVFDVPPGIKGLQLDVQGIKFSIPD